MGLLAQVLVPPFCLLGKGGGVMCASVKEHLRQISSS